MYGSSDAGDDVNQSANYVYKNGTNQGFSGVHIDDEVSYFVASKSMILTLSAGDYIEVYAKVFGAAFNVESESSYFSAFKLNIGS